jgi:hypothetical protein
MRLIAELTMPRVGSWSGTWSGAKEKYTKSIQISAKTAESLIGSYEYNWSDGWCACVTIRKPEYRERATNKFCGYDWMIKSIITHGKIKA